MMKPLRSQLPAFSPLAVLLLALALAVPAAGETAESWPQWGGPNQDFRAASEGLAKSWPEDGPPEIWSRELGDGYSTILYEDGRLYTMYRADDKEAVICLDAKTGKTLWEHRYDSAPHENHVTQFGSGPRATPLLAGDRLYAVGISGVMHSLDKETGEVVWSRDLWKDFDGTFLNHGYSSSPIEYEDKVIVLVGGEGHAVVAFNKKDGSVAWKGLDFANSYSTPQIFEVGGEPMLVAFMANEIIGVDPDSGELLWQHPHQNQFQQNISAPILVDGKTLFFSSPQAGARGLELTRKDGKVETEELWSTRKIQFYHVTTVRDGDYVYGSTGIMAPAFLSAINAKTGEIAWRKRGFAKANIVYADGKLIILDEDGKLYLATATPEDLEVHSEAKIFDEVAWSAPTIIGKTLYVRDKAKIMALDLG